jgi:hypothetical protein
MDLTRSRNCTVNAKRVPAVSSRGMNTIFSSHYFNCSSIVLIEFQCIQLPSEAVNGVGSVFVVELRGAVPGVTRTLQIAHTVIASAN